MNPTLRNIASRLHTLDSAQGAHIARINSVDPNASTLSPLARVTNQKPTKRKPNQETGAYVSSRHFVSSAQSTTAEKATQTAYFRLHGALADSGVSAPDLLREYNDLLRSEAASRKAVENMSAETADKLGAATNGKHKPALTA